jgi:hypothetical protein
VSAQYLLADTETAVNPYREICKRDPEFSLQESLRYHIMRRYSSPFFFFYGDHLRNVDFTAYTYTNQGLAGSNGVQQRPSHLRLDSYQSIENDSVAIHNQSRSFSSTNRLIDQKPEVREP